MQKSTMFSFEFSVKLGFLVGVCKSLQGSFKKKIQKQHMQLKTNLKNNFCTFLIFYPTLLTFVTLVFGYIALYFWISFTKIIWGNCCGVGVNMLDYHIIVSEFKFQSCYYIHFWNTLGKGMNPLILPPAMGK